MDIYADVSAAFTLIGDFIARASNMQAAIVCKNGLNDKEGNEKLLIANEVFCWEKISSLASLLSLCKSRMLKIVNGCFFSMIKERWVYLYIFGQNINVLDLRR